jgi:hypothetical protein
MRANQSTKPLGGSPPDPPDPPWLDAHYIKHPPMTGWVSQPWHVIGGYRVYVHDGRHGWAPSVRWSVVPLCRVRYWIAGWDPDGVDLRRDLLALPPDERLCKHCRSLVAADPAILSRPMPKLKTGEQLTKEIEAGRPDPPKASTRLNQARSHSL